MKPNHERSSKRISHTVRYPEGSVRPEDFRRFIQLGTFEEDWRRLGLNDEDLQALEILIMLGPDRPPVVPGTGGLRKIRFACSRWDRGKSGGVRVGYAHFPASSVVVLIAAYTHAEKDNLSPAECKVIRTALRNIGLLLAQGA